MIYDKRRVSHLWQSLLMFRYNTYSLETLEGAASGRVVIDLMLPVNTYSAEEMRECIPSLGAIQLGMGISTQLCDSGWSTGFNDQF